MEDAIAEAEMEPKAAVTAEETTSPASESSQNGLEEDDEDFRDVTSHDPSPRPQERSEGDNKYGFDIYKKWYRASGAQGFMTVSGWPDQRKIAIDIGTAGSEGLQSNAKAWVDGVKLLTYLHSVFIGNADKLFPKSDKLGIPTPEGFVVYGGAMVDGSPVSRIIKIHHTGGEGNFDPSRFVIKVGHFHARKSQQGAFIPDMKRNIVMHSINMTRQEMAHLYEEVALWMQVATAKRGI